ncbi:YggU-like protein [Coemansia reversa NRRL 1564]|uniref:YggU-like protein n=1 Tax=Coemansia reversa (strain ATCC 12441 / NRRL 1564) TaxID=763665 RepID=A0A2G5BFC5_COERN|nr:YggU-like protein [Coemansia reversa NRRL 1564]|eukprot:PIA17427.1 YggU-like protein [Coemansia reversa NRRL 1564]
MSFLLNKQSAFLLRSRIIARCKSAERNSKPSADSQGNSQIRNPQGEGGPVFRQGDKIGIRVHAKPCAHKNNITSIDNAYVHIRIAAQPLDGKANKKLVEFMAQLLGCPKSTIELVQGKKTNYKFLHIIHPKNSITDIVDTLRANIKLK